MKIEELVSSGCLKKLLKNRVQQENLRELYEFLQTTKTLSSPYVTQVVKKSNKKFIR